MKTGRLFHSTHSIGAENYQIGSGEVTKGWDLAIKTMRFGEKAEFTIHSEYAYGDIGFPPLIKQDADLVYQIELLGIVGVTASDISDEVLIRLAKGFNRQGNQYFSEGKFQDARQAHESAIYYIDLIKDQTDSTKDLQVKLYQNVSLDFNQLGEFDLALIQCTRVIQLDSSAAKAYFIRALAYSGKKLFDKALEDLAEAIKIEPDDVELLAERTKIETLRASYIAEQEILQKKWEEKRKQAKMEIKIKTLTGKFIPVHVTNQTTVG